MFGVNRECNTSRNPLKITDQARTDDWQLGQVKGKGKFPHLHEVRIYEESRRNYESQKTEQEYHGRWGLERGTVVERVDTVSSDHRPGRHDTYISQSYPPYILGTEDESSIDIILSTFMPPPTSLYHRLCTMKMYISSVRWKAVSPFTHLQTMWNQGSP